MISNTAKSAELISEIRTGTTQEIRALEDKVTLGLMHAQLPLAFILAISRDLTRLISVEDDFQYCKER